MIVTLQAQLDPEVGDNSKMEFTQEELQTIEEALFTLCTKLEKLSYIRCQMYVDGKDWRSIE